MNKQTENELYLAFHDAREAVIEAEEILDWARSEGADTTEALAALAAAEDRYFAAAKAVGVGFYW